jgi:hypothetical protein
VRWYEQELPEGCTLWGRQLTVARADILYTSHNSSACAVVEIPDASLLGELTERALAHLERHASKEATPDCASLLRAIPLSHLVAFGRRAATEVVTQADAVGGGLGAPIGPWWHQRRHHRRRGRSQAHRVGWSGRFVEFGRLRDYPDEVTVGELEGANMLVLPVDRNVVSPTTDDVVDTAGWLRPRLWGGVPAVPVTLLETGRWFALGKAGSPFRADIGEFGHVHGMGERGAA